MYIHSYTPITLVIVRTGYIHNNSTYNSKFNSTFKIQQKKNNLEKFWLIKAKYIEPSVTIYRYYL